MRPKPHLKGWGLKKEKGEKKKIKATEKGAEPGSDVPGRVPQPLPPPLRMWVPLLLLLPELLPAVPAQKLSALTVRPPRRGMPAPGRT